MAKSKYEYVKDFEKENICLPNCWIVVRVNGKLFTKSDDAQQVFDLNDTRAYELMNCAAKTVMNEFRDIVLAYGARDEFSFIFKKDTELYNRREFKLVSYVFSRFSSSIVSNWSKFFKNIHLEHRPFSVTAILYPTDEDLRCYLSCRQASIYANNIGNSHLWSPQIGDTLRNQFLLLRDELLREKYTIGNIDEMLIIQRGSTLIRKKVPNNEGKMKQCVVVINENIISDRFWQENPDIIATKILPHVNRNKKSGRRSQTGVHSEIKNLLKTNNISTSVDKYEYIESFERDNICSTNCWIVVRIDGKGFTKFCDTHKFIKPNDIRALELMNCAATTVMTKCSDIVMAFGASDEYSFIFKKDTKIFNRRESELSSEVLWWFSTSYVLNWTKYFEKTRLKFPPSFDARVVIYPSDQTLRDYLSWRQADVHINNLYNTCFWNLIQRKSMTPSQAGERLKGTLSAEKNELLLQDFGVDYNDELPIVRKGSTVIRKKMSNDEGKLIQRVVTIYDDIIGDEFFHKNPEVLGGGISSSVQFENLESLKRENICLPNCWIVVTVNGKNFSDFCDAHQFVRPNDIRGLELMNSAATIVMNECPEIILAFGASDDYSFVFKKDTKLYNRRETELSTYVLSRFSSLYELNWTQFIGDTRLEFLPSFEAEVVLYPNKQDLRDYLSLRQVDVHNNNLYNTCFWNLIQRQNMSPSQAREKLQDTSSSFRNELLFQDFGINYNNELPIFRKGSTLIRRNVPNDERKVEQQIVTIHEDIIGD